MDRFNVGGVCAARYRSQNRTYTAEVKAPSYLQRYCDVESLILLL